MVEVSEPNAQNSELNPEIHPSGARIEKMMEDANTDRMKKRNKEEKEAGERAGVERPSIEKGPIEKGEKGQYGETLRPSEREDRHIIPQDEPVEGGRDEIPDFPDADSPPAPHRMNANDRESRG